jgi:excisionase family DNA binding protein
MSNKEWTTTQEIAERLGIHVETVRRWLRTGSLRGVYVGGKGGYRIRQNDLEEFLRSKENPKAA